MGSVTIFSCVGGGPMERLARSLRERGDEAVVSARYTGDQWRRRMAAGRTGRLRSRLGAMVAFPVRAVERALRAPRGSVLVPTTNPFFLPLVLVATRPLHRKRVVPLVYDLYPDALEAAGFAGDASWARSAMRAANRSWLRAADGVVFIGRRMADHIERSYGPVRRSTIIETGADARELSPLRDDELAESSLEDWCRGKVIASYVGNLGHVHDWDTLADAGLVLADRRATLGRPFGIVVAASGPGVEHLRQRWARLPPDFVRFEPPLEDRAWARLLGLSDISLVTLKNEAHQTCVPSKAFSALAAGSALVAVAPRHSDFADLVVDHGCGVVVAPGDVAGLVRGIEKFLASDTSLAEARDRALNAARGHYDTAVLAGRWRNFLGMIPEPRPVAMAMKRGVDLVASALGLIALAPVLGAAALGVRASMGDPVLFRQPRPGRDGRPFLLLKFRTMNAPKPGREGPEHDAERMTRLGRFLRATSIDELPTLWNVLRGDMSLVGPRPLLMRYLDRYSKRQAHRHDVRPGITGWAQVHGRNAIDWDEKLELDVWYVENWSFWLDLKILLATVLTVLRREGISQEGHATMPEFLGSSPSSSPEARA